MTVAIVRGLAKDLHDELLAMADRGETTMTILAYVARFPADQQRQVFKELNKLGSRGAKRFVECLSQPPTTKDIARRLLGWLAREFPEPAVDINLVAQACELVASAIRQTKEK